MIKNLIIKNIKVIIIIIGISFFTFLIFYNSYYFDFDKIEHYQISEEENYFDGENDSIKVESQKILSEILFDRKPTELNGTEFLNDLNKIVFTKHEIPISDFNEIREIFKEQSCSKNIEMACISVFRDVLVFFKKNKIVGIAKVCFSCKDNHIIGTTSETFNFGQCGDYEKLNGILY